MRRASIIAGLVLCASMLAGRRADAQRADPRLEARLDARTAASVQAAVDAARADALPTEPLVLKALEGASKGARGPQIMTAIGRLHDQLRASRASLGGASSGAEIVAGVAALQAGVHPKVLGDLRTARPAATLEVPLTVLADLVGRGVPVATASETVLSLVRANTDDGEIAAAGQGVGRGARGGTAPGPASHPAGSAGPPAGLPVTPGIPPPPPTGKGPPPSS